MIGDWHSQIFVLIVLVARLIFEKDTAHYLKLGFAGGSIGGADLDLSLERTVLPVVELVFVVAGHFQSFSSVFVDELEEVASIERLCCRFRLALQDPVIVWVNQKVLSSPSPPSPKADTSWPLVMSDWKISSECRFRLVRACSSLIVSPQRSSWST